LSNFFIYFFVEMKSINNIFKVSYIIISKNIYLSVCTAIDSTPGSDTVLRPISLEPVWPEVCDVKKFSKKVTSGQIVEEKCYVTNAFQWENMFSLAIKDSDWVFFSYHLYRSNHFYRFYWFSGSISKQVFLCLPLILPKLDLT
jgi:hypothetical protein